MKLDINLASRSYINRRALFTFYLIVSVILLVLFAFNIRYFVKLKAQRQQVENRLVEVRRDLGELDNDAPKEVSKAQMEALREKIAFANDILEKDSFRWTALLGYLEEVVTDGARIRSIQPQFKEGSLKIEGVAKSVPALRALIDSIVASPHFSNVYLFNQSREKIEDAAGREQEAVRFSIELKGAF